MGVMIGVGLDGEGEECRYIGIVLLGVIVSADNVLGIERLSGKAYELIGLNGVIDLDMSFWVIKIWVIQRQY